MNSPWHPSLRSGVIALSSCLALLLFSAPPSHAVLGLFGKDDKVAPPPEKIAQAEEEATKLLADAQRLTAENKFGRARDIHQKIVKNYPLTSAAAASQFAIGQSLEAEGNLLGAFDAYQIFVEKYIHEEKFSEAISRQYAIASNSMTDKTATVLGFFKTKPQPSKIVEMFRRIATSAPYTEFAPKALFHIGSLEQEAGNAEPALAALQEVIDNYPKDPVAKEASLKIIEIREGHRTRDDSHIGRTQIEMEKFLYDYADDPRAAGMRTKVDELNERDAQKKLEIGQYYQKKKDYRAAAIYYQSVTPGSQAHPKAQAALQALAAIDPNFVQSPSAPKQRVIANSQVTQNPNYVGPPPPSLKPATKPKMRVSEEDLKPIPVD